MIRVCSYADHHGGRLLDLDSGELHDPQLPERTPVTHGLCRRCYLRVCREHGLTPHPDVCPACDDLVDADLFDDRPPAAGARREADVDRRRRQANAPHTACCFCGRELSNEPGVDREWVGRFNSPMCDYHARAVGRSAT